MTEAQIYEYQGQFSDNLLRICQNGELYIKNLMLQRDINNVLHFTESLKIKTINCILIKNVGNNKLPDNLLSRYFQGTVAKKSCSFCWEETNNMEIFTEWSPSSDEKLVSLVLDSNDEKNTHENIIEFVFGLMDVVEVKSYTAITDENARCKILVMIRQLEKYLPLVRNLALVGIPFSVDDGIRLAAYLPLLQSLKAHSRKLMSFPYVIEKNYDYVACLVLHTSHLQTLDLSSNYIKKESISKIAEAIVSRHSNKGMVLRELILDSCRLFDNIIE